MELVQVRIKGMVVTAQYGSLSSGDVLRTTPAFAKHLVEDCAAAEYINPVVEDKPLEKKEPEPAVEKEPEPAVEDKPHRSNKGK